MLGRLTLVAKFFASILVKQLVSNHGLRFKYILVTTLQIAQTTVPFCLYMLRCPTFRADIITAVKARSLDIFVQGVLKNFSDQRPCGKVDIFHGPDWVFVLMMTPALAICCLILFGYLTAQPASDVRKDGSRVDSEVRNTKELLGKDEVLHDKPDYDRTSC